MFDFLKRKEKGWLYIKLDNGVKISNKDPGKGIRFQLICTEKHENWVYNIPKPSGVRIGSVRSKISFIRCLECDETLKGGVMFNSNKVENLLNNRREV